MRLYLLPISTRRTLLYCHRVDVVKSEAPTWSEWVQSRAAKLWAGWEKKDKGWQKKVVNYGNYALRRIPYEEWGLKSVPPLSERRKIEELNGTDKVEVVYPESLIRHDSVAGLLKKLGTERESLHRKKLIWCFVGMPITAPVALIPIIPNLPFFYLVYRAWSHWRALSGGRHIQFLLQNNLLALQRSPIIDQVYAKQKQPLPSSVEPTTDSEADPLKNPNTPETSEPEPEAGETMLLSQENCKRMTQALDIPQLEVELERAIWQVGTAIEKQNEEASKEAPENASEKPASNPDPEDSQDDKKTR